MIKDRNLRNVSNLHLNRNFTPSNEGHFMSLVWRCKILLKFFTVYNEFGKEAGILIDNEEQKNDKLIIRELTLEIDSLKEKMEQILYIIQNKTIETPKAQNTVDRGVGNQENFNKNENTMSKERLGNINISRSGSALRL